MSTIGDLERSYLLGALGPGHETSSLNDLRYLYYSGAPSRESMSVGAPISSRVVALGDSLVKGSDTFSSGAITYNNSWPAVAAWLSGQKISLVANAGVGGDTIAQMLARFDKDVARYQPSTVFLMGGTNDITQDVPIETSQRNFLSLIQKTLSLGARPVLCTIPPKNPTGTYGSRISSWNMWLKGLAAKYNYPLLDFYNLLVDPATGNLNAASGSSDGTHPGTEGYYLMGEYAAGILFNLLPPPSSLLPTDNLTGANLLTNPLFIDDTNADNVPNGWTSSGGGTKTYLLSPHSQYGKILAVDVTSTGSINGVTQTVNNAVSPGDIVRFVGEYTCDAANSLVAQVVVSGGHFSGRGVNNPILESSGSWDLEFEVPGGSNIVITLGAASGQATFARVGLYNMTRLGLA